VAVFRAMSKKIWSKDGLAPTKEIGPYAYGFSLNSVFCLASFGKPLQRARMQFGMAYTRGGGYVFLTRSGERERERPRTCKQTSAMNSLS